MQPNAALDVFPTIIVGNKYGDYTNNFDPDIATIVSRMRSAGLTDSQIAETTIHFSDNPSPEKGDYITYGYYTHHSKEITIFGIEKVAQAIAEPATLAKDAQDNLSETLIHELEHRIASFDAEHNKADLDYHRRLRAFGKRPTAFALGGFAVSSIINNFNIYTLHRDPPLAEFAVVTAVAVFAALQAERVFFKEQLYNEYVNSPAEKRARATEDIHQDLVKITLKQIENTNS